MNWKNSIVILLLTVTGCGVKASVQTKSTVQSFASSLKTTTGLKLTQVLTQGTATSSTTSRTDAQSSASSSGPVIGNIDGLFYQSGESALSGWACAQGNPDSIMVHLYAGGAYPRGEFVTGVIANHSSESAVASACGSNGTAYRFLIPISQQQRVQFDGKQIFVHGISPTGGQNPLIGGSGTYVIPEATQFTSCEVADLASLKGCMARLSTFQILDFTNDVSCSGTGCCDADGKGALINLDRSSYKVVAGNGHILHRHGSQTTCSAMSMSSSSYIWISSLNIDEDETVPFCSPYQNCANAVQSFDSNNINFENFGLYNAKAYGVYIWANDHVLFNHSTVSNTGIIALYAGDGSYSASDASQHIFVTQSLFARTRTNAVAFQGVFGSQPGDNAIEGNIFNANHYAGQWIQSDGLPYDGGQLYLPNVRYLHVSDNTIADGACATCGSRLVWGIEIGPEGSIVDLEVANNYLYNEDGMPFYLNVGGQIGRDSSFTNNTIFGYTQATNVTSATFSGNAMTDTKPSLAHSGTAGYRIYRLRLTNGLHDEANTAGESSGAILEGIFQLSPSPRVGALNRPIYRCFIAGTKDNDFPSFDPNCEGQQHFHSILGYSYEVGHPGSQPFYRCRKGSSDNFISWDSHCEGQVFEGMLGSAIPGN